LTPVLVSVVVPQRIQEPDRRTDRIIITISQHYKQDNRISRILKIIPSKIHTKMVYYLKKITMRFCWWFPLYDYGSDLLEASTLFHEPVPIPWFIKYLDFYVLNAAHTEHLAFYLFRKVIDQWA